MNQKEGILMDKLRVTARKVVPPGGHVWLYGSRARGTAHDDSDWDLLILLDQPEITTADEDNIAYPLVVEGWKNDFSVSLQIYTVEEWRARSHTPYYKNVEHDKMAIL